MDVTVEVDIDIEADIDSRAKFRARQYLERPGGSVFELTSLSAIDTRSGLAPWGRMVLVNADGDWSSE